MSRGLGDVYKRQFHRGLLQDSFRRDALVNYLHIIQPILDEWIENLKSKKSFVVVIKHIDNLELEPLLNEIKSAITDQSSRKID